MPFSLMMKGRNNGKKLLAVRIVAHAFEIIHLFTDQNPIQVCAVAPRRCTVLSDLSPHRSSSMRSSTRVPVKTPPVSVPRALSGVRLSMCLLSDA